jgi:hypothetical protein
METSREIDVTALDDAHRLAFEEIIGAPLQQNQRLIIRVTEIEVKPGHVPPSRLKIGQVCTRG